MSKRKLFVGSVISDKMKKTILVKIMRLAKHPKYNKIVKKYNKFKAHDEKNEARLGDIVQIAETRPLSKDKHFRVVKILKKAETLAVGISEAIPHL